MSKWLIAIVFGVIVVVGVYFLREHIVSTPIGGTPQTAPGTPETGTPAAPAMSPDQMDDDGSTVEEAAPSAPALPDGPTIPPGSASTLISIDFPWARATPDGAKTTAIYMLLTNNGTADAYLMGASSPDADRTEIHQTVVEGTVVAMKPVAHLDLEPGVPTALEEGGLHLMLIGLKHPLKDGDTVDVTLDFGEAGPVAIKVPVGAPEDSDENPAP